MLSLHDALPICVDIGKRSGVVKILAPEEGDELVTRSILEDEVVDTTGRRCQWNVHGQQHMKHRLQICHQQGCRNPLAGYVTYGEDMVGIRGLNNIVVVPSHKL